MLRENREPQTWEIVGAVLGYFGIIGDVPTACRTLGIGHFVPDCLKSALLNLYSHPDGWYAWFFTVLLLMFLFGLVWKSSPPEPDIERDNIEEAKKYLKRSQILRAVRSLGLVPLREWLMDKMGIALYGTFKRPSDWTPNLNTWLYLDRITFNSGRGSEYQYAKNFNYVSVREHPETSDNYGQPAERKPTWVDFKHLIIASWFFPFWAIIHLLKRPFTG